MTGTKDKVHKVLSENRTLILGAQILLGFQYQAVFRPGFDRLPEHAKTLEAVTLAMLLVTIACLIAPSPFHRIAENGEDTARVHDYAKRMIELALAPFALAIGANVHIATETFLGTGYAAVLGVAAAAVAFLLWYGIELMMRRPDKPQSRSQSGESRGEDDGGTPLKEKINDILTETRIVLPGAQALLGFQLAAYLTESFEKLPQISKIVHTASLLLIALAVILLMTPAPFHRIAENGEDTERFDKFAVRIVLAALVPLSLGLAGELFVVLHKIAESTRLAAAGAAVMVVGSLALWFAVPLLARRGASR